MYIIVYNSNHIRNFVDNVNIPVFDFNTMNETNQKSVPICIRVPIGVKERIDKDILETKEFSSASQWYLAALREFLYKRESIRKDGSGGGGLTVLKTTKKSLKMKIGVFPTPI